MLACERVHEIEQDKQTVDIKGDPLTGFQAGAKTCRKTLDKIDQAIQQEQSFNAEILAHRKNGEPHRTAIELKPVVGADESIDRFFSIQSGIISRVRAEQQNRKLQQEIVVASRQAGMAEVATGVLHNVGNILNRVNVSTSMI